MSTQPNLTNDLSVLTKIPNKALKELTHKINLCIASIIADAKMQGDQTVIINIGIGTLSIDLIDMQSKFIPSKELRSTIKTCLTEPVDLLALEVEQTLVDKLVSFCDEVL